MLIGGSLVGGDATELQLSEVGAAAMAIFSAWSTGPIKERGRLAATITDVKSPEASVC
jgi:hypothetical protein